MADEIIRTIYKLEIDDSGYIRGVESLSASTNKFAEIQSAANKALQILEAALAEQSKAFQQAKKDLESYTGADEKYRQQLLKTYNEQKAQNDKLVGLVSQARQEYEKATKAAQDFANTSAKANTLQSQPGARITQQQPSVPAGLNAQIFNTINLTDMAELAEITAKTKTEFDELADSILLAEERLKQLDPASEEFKQLAPLVEQGNKALQDFRAANEQAADSSGSLRSQIRLGKEELVKLEAAGKGNTKEYIELEKRVAKLTDAFGDQQARIKILASDTKLLDFGKGAITAATSAFQAYTSISILAGDQSEELQKKTMQLFAAMQLLQSLEQLSNLTRREGVLATLAQSGAQAAYTAVVGASTGALRAFKLALAATGIGVVITGIAFLITRLQDAAKAAQEAAAAQKQLNEVSNEAIKSFTAEVTHLQLIKDRLTDLNVPQKERIALAKEYNKTAEEGNKIDLKQIDNIALVNKAIDSQIAKIKERAQAKAAENVITQKQEAVFLAEESARNRLISSGQVILTDQKDRDNFFVKQELDRLVGLQTDVIDARKELEFALRNLSPLIKPGDLFKIDPGKTDTKEIENVFAQKLKELQAKLAEVTAKSFESEGTIRAQFAASLEKEISDINKLVKDKKLTKDQATILIDLTTKINDVQLNEALSQFNKKVLDARNKLNEEIRDLQLKNTEETIKLIQDEFEQRRQLIDFNEKQQIEDSKANTVARLAALEEQRDLVGEEQYQIAKNAIVKAGEDEQTNIIIQASRDRQQLAADTFRASLDAFNSIFEEQILGLNEQTAGKIQEEKNLFNTGVINYNEFQKRITKILSDEKKERDRLRLEELKSELNSIDNRLNTSITDKERSSLNKRKDEIRGQIADLQSETGDIVDPNKKRIETVQDYANAIGGLADSVIQFWQKANEAEQKALERSIELQEKRVEAAQRIAERGNAQYLKAEEDRLKELQVARENAARRQLGIDAALQASQILVGITGAIAKIANPVVGIAETISSIAVIVGALATGYGLVKSLQGNQPRFFVGTKDTGAGGKEDNKGGFQAVLHPHEAVIPRDKNEKYKPAVAAIYDGSIPPEVLNNFVNHYHSVKQVPQVNYERIKEAAELKINYDGKMAVILSEHSGLLKENNDLQKQILAKRIKVEQTIDRNGVAAMVTEYIEQQKIDRLI